jgi:hypothetical protein
MKNHNTQNHRQKKLAELIKIAKIKSVVFYGISNYQK